MSVVPQPVWPRRRVPWLRNRFGRGLLTPRAVRLRLRRPWASYHVVERWLRLSPVVERAGRQQSLAVSVSFSVLESLGQDRSARGLTRHLLRVTSAPRPTLAGHPTPIPAQPLAVSAMDSPHARLDLLTTRLVEQSVLNARGQRGGSDSGPTLVAASPARVLARAPRWEQPSRSGSDRGRLQHDPGTRPIPGSEPAIRAPDIERLTDGVVAAIDRRVRSHRERMGGR